MGIDHELMAAAQPALYPGESVVAVGHVYDNEGGGAISSAVVTDRRVIIFNIRGEGWLGMGKDATDWKEWWFDEIASVTVENGGQIQFGDRSSVQGLKVTLLAHPNCGPYVSKYRQHGRNYERTEIAYIVRSPHGHHQGHDLPSGQAAFWQQFAGYLTERVAATRGTPAHPAMVEQRIAWKDAARTALYRVNQAKSAAASAARNEAMDAGWQRAKPWLAPGAAGLATLGFGLTAIAGFFQVMSWGLDNEYGIKFLIKACVYLVIALGLGVVTLVLYNSTRKRLAAQAAQAPQAPQQPQAPHPPGA